MAGAQALMPSSVALSDISRVELEVEQSELKLETLGLTYCATALSRSTSIPEGRKHLDNPRKDYHLM